MMHERELINQLAELTGSLKPSANVTSKDLREVRRVLANFLMREGSAASARARTAVDEVGLVPEPSAMSDIVEEVLNELREVASEAVEARGVVPEPEALEVELGARVFRRELPVVTSQVSGSVPKWAAGRRIDQTIGPFLDPSGRPYWFDIYFSVQQVSVVRHPSTTPILKLPFKGFLLKSDSHYKVPAGSIWILSKLLTPTAPEGAYTGLRIKGGTITLSSPATVSGGTMKIAADTKLILKVKLDPTPHPGPTNGPGVDAGDIESQTPATATFVFSGNTCEVATAADAFARIYENEFRLVKSLQLPVYEPLLNRILVPFDTTASEIRIEQARSQLFTPSGTVPVAGAAWALPVAQSTPESLGEAAGTGALVVRSGKGLRAIWRGLKRRVSLGTLFMVEPGRLVVVSEGAVGAGSGQTLKLWREAPGSDRRAAISLRYQRSFTLRYFSERGAQEALLVEAGMEASFDRPLCSDGTHLPLRFERATAVFWEDTSGFRFLLLAQSTLTGGVAPTVRSPISMALSNALLKTTAPLVLVVFGEMNDDESLERGTVALYFGLYTILPFLPDPYVTNLTLSRSRVFDTLAVAPSVTLGAGSLHGALLALVRWLTPDNPNLSFRLIGAEGALAAGTTASVAIGSSATSSNAPISQPGSFVGLVQRDPVKIATEDAQRVAGLRSIFEKTAGPVKESIFLLDVSTNADWLGVGLGLARQQPPTHVPPPTSPAQQSLQIQSVSLVTHGQNVRVFTVPQFQWEPVVTEPTPDSFPSPMASAGDGGPTLIGANSVTLVPIAPTPVLEQIITEYNQEPRGTPTAMLFTLPFGMKAAANLQRPTSPSGAGAHLTLNRPRSIDANPLIGGLQITVRAISPDSGPDVESPTLPGATVQTRNGINPVTLTPFGMSVLSGPVPGADVETIFNNEMMPGGGNQRVPVTRIDFCGYGASMFSNWYNPNAAVAQTSQVRFDVMLGRTAYEVVQVKSILFPWAVPVVRTITIQRRKEGIVFRRDSGWVAVAPGLYDYPEPDEAVVSVPAGWGNPVATHPGVVRGAYDVRRIRETGRVYTKTVVGTDVVLAEVRFDADFEIQRVVSGQGSNGRVPSRGQVGFIQIAPFGLPLYDVAFAQLLADEGPLGGPVDCVIDVGGSGQTMRIARVDVGAAPSVSGHEFAAAARGALDLPNDGEWSMLRHDFSVNEPQAVDRDSGTPLLREGKVGATPSQRYRFADPADLLRESNPVAEYALMQSSSAHRVLFPRPRIREGGSEITSTQRAVLADAYALLSGVGLFPERNKCFESTAPYTLRLRADGRYKLDPPTAGFVVPSGLARRELSNTAAFKIFTNYPTGSQITFTLDPDAPVPWSMREQNIGVGMDLGPFEALMTVNGEFYIEDGSPAQLRSPELVYGAALGPVNALIKLLTKVAELLGAETPFGVSMTNPEFKMKAAVEINIGLLAKIVFGASAVDADGYFELFPQGPKVKGGIGAGFSNDPGSLPEAVGLPPGTPEEEAIAEAWHGYFYVTLGMEVPIVLPIFGGGEAEVELRGNELTGYAVEIKMQWGVSLGAKVVGVLSVSGRFYFGVILEAGEDFFGIGILIGVSGSASVLEGLFAITVRFEIIGLIEATGGTTEAVGQALVATEITVCWFITISFEVEVEVREEISV